MFTDLGSFSVTPLGCDSPDWGPVAIPLHPRSLEKIAGSTYIPEKLLDFMDKIRPRDDGVYVLLNAIGSLEYWGCFTGENLVLTERGYLPIKDVVVGDSVVSHRGIFRKVLTKFEYTHHTKGAKIKLSGVIDPIVCTEEHGFFSVDREAVLCERDKYARCIPESAGSQSICLRTSGRRGTCTKTATVALSLKAAKDLRLKDYLVCPLPKHDQAGQLSLQEARVAGLWLAEGCFIHQKSRFSSTDGLDFVFNVAETDLVDEVIGLAKVRGSTIHGPYPASGGSCLSIRVMDTLLAYKFEKWFGQYAAGKKIPSWMANQPEDVICNLLAGYFDGDGTVNIKDGVVTGSTASKQLALGIQRLLWSVRIPATVCPVKGVGHFRINFTIERGDKVFSLMSKRKDHEVKGGSHYQQFFFDDYVALPIRKLERVSLKGKKTYDLEVEEEHSYNVSQVAVHNSNKNGDGFPEWSLLGDPIPLKVKDYIRENKLPVPVDYGYTTFERYAYVYSGHNNKDPIHAIGERVCCASYNDRMHRVELIVFVANDKAPDVVRRINAGEPVPWSMGSKLPWDSCGRCGHAATRREDYCDCLKNHLNEIMPDGTKVFSYNYFPRFFDISVVMVPADRSAYSLKKVASVQTFFGIDEETGLALPVPEGMAKFAGIMDYLSTGGDKKAEITKKIPAQAPAENLGPSPIDPALWDFIRDMVRRDRSRTETAPEIMNLDGPLPSILSALTSMGVIMNPEEVEHVTGGSAFPQDLELQTPSATIMEKVKPLVRRRSMFDPHFSDRVSQELPEAPRKIVVLAKRASYEGYRRWLRERLDLDKLAQVAAHPSVRLFLDPNAVEAKMVGLGFEKAATDHPNRMMMPFIAGAGMDE